MFNYKKGRLPIEIIEIVIIAFALSWFMKSYLIQLVKIDNTSMLPTLSQNNVVMVDKFFYSKLNNLERGDIVVYLSPEQKKIEVKRLIGLPGDTVEIRNGYTYVNSQPLYEPYAQIPVSYVFQPITIPDEQFFVLNDNRTEVDDSRYEGNLPLHTLEGKAIFGIWPLTSFKNL